MHLNATAKVIVLITWFLFLMQISHAQTLTKETGNNTAACSGVGDPLGLQSYCAGYFAGFATTSSNTNAQTKVADSIPGHMSPLPLKTYLYHDATTKFIAPYQAWFCTTGPAGPYNGTQTCTVSNAGSHKIVGYNENSSSVVATQHTHMINLGYWAVSPDWYGTNTAKQGFINQTVIAEVQDLSTRNNKTYPLKLLIMLDGGAVLAGTNTLAGCPQDHNDETTCITQNIEADLDYIDSNWAENPYYARDSSGANLVTFFLTECSWPSVGCSGNSGLTNWATIMNDVYVHIASYKTPMKLIKEYGNFTEYGFSGAYAWPQPLVYVNGNNNGYTYPAIPSVTGDCTTSAPGCMQFYWNQPGANNYQYLDDFYSLATTTYKGDIALGELFKGFDWSNASWGNPQKIIAQQCGQILTDSAAKINAAYSSTMQLEFAQTPTWNDYEEGAEVETGVDNCYQVQNAAYSQSQDQLTWQLNPVSGQQNYVSLSTVHGYTVWVASSTGALRSIASLPATATSLNNVSSLVGTHGAGTKLYVEMVGMPLIINRMSNGVPFP
jgi:hypothetical protein